MFGRKSYKAVENQANFWDETSSHDLQYLTSKSLFNHEYASGDSPTVTNSERSKITETLTEFNHLNQILQAQSMQQPGYSDMQFVQQHAMLKQLQELRRQQTIHQFGDPRQQSSLNQIYNLSKQGSSFIDGIPVDPRSQMFMNMMHRDAFPNQAFYQTSMASQQQDGALYGTPTSNKQGIMTLNSQDQGLGNDSHNFSAKSIGFTQKSNKSFLPNNVSVNQDTFFQEGSLFKQGFQRVNASERGVQELVSSRNIHLSINQKNNLFRDVISRQDLASWPEPSLGLVPLDPIEEKILYNMEDNVWDASYGTQNDGGFGSWSALMQSAVAEASSSDNTTAIQEEWSGLTFQNTELSNENQPSNLMDREKIQPNWIDNNLQSPSSSSSRQFSAVNDSVMGFSFDQNEHLRQEDSHESIHKSFTNAGKWLNCNSKQTPRKDLNNRWVDQILERSESDMHTYQHQTASYDNVSQPCIERGVHEITFNRNETDGFRWKTDGGSQQLDYMKNPGLSADENTEARGSNFNKMSNGSIAMQNSYEEAGQTYFEEKNRGPKLYNDHHSSMSSQEERQGFLTVPRTNAKTSETSEGDLGPSANFSFAHNGQNVSGKNSHNMLKLLHKVDQSKDNSLIPHFHSPPSLGLPMHTEEGFTNTLFDKQQDLMSTSQGFSYSHSAYMPLSPRRLANIRLGDRNQTSLPFSFNARTLTSNESSKNAYWDEKSNTSSFQVQGDSIGAFGSNPQYGRSQLQMQDVSTHLSSHASFPGMGSQLPVFNASCSQDVSHRLTNDNYSAQYPVLEEARPVAQSFRMPGMSQAINRIETPMFVSKGLKRQMSQEDESTSSNNGTTTNLQGYLNKEGVSERTISSDIEDTSLHGEIPRKIPNSKGTTSLSLLASLEQQNFGRFQHSENNIAIACGRSYESSSKFVKQSKFGDDYPRIQNIEDKTVETDLRKVNIELDASSRLKNNLTNFIRGSGDNAMVVSQNQSKIQHGSTNVELSSFENSPHNPHFVPSWFKQNGESRNGQMPMPPIYNAFHAKAAYPPVNLHAQSSLDRQDSACASQSGQISLSGAALLTSSDPLTSPHLFASDVSGQNIAMLRSKKRKSVSFDLLPWREEVKQGSPRILSISMVEQAWAESTHRLIDEVGNEFEPIEDGLPSYRSKRRLILTAQLMQQLLLPAPVSFLSADVSSFYDSVTYFVARLSLGDACSLICNARKDCNNSMNNDDSVSDKHEYFSNTVENLSKRIEKLENDLLRCETRLDKAVSVLNLRVESQELERFSIINRFAKFHVRQSDGASSSGFSVNTSKTCLQRYVTAYHPMLMILPEEVQCLAL